MTPGQAILTQVANLLATDATTLAPAAGGVAVKLASNSFSPSPGLSLASLTEATFPGYTAKNAGVGPQQLFGDPITQYLIVQLLEPAGGWTWLSTGAPPVAETIFGFYVTNNGGTVLYGSALLAAPITINGGGQGVSVGVIRFTFPPTVPF